MNSVKQAKCTEVNGGEFQVRENSPSRAGISIRVFDQKAPIEVAGRAGVLAIVVAVAEVSASTVK